MLHVLEVFRASCDDIIARHGGYVASYVGDGVLAYFGYPSANEEDASNAVRAALDLQKAMGSLPLPDGIVCQARIGVATGLVVINDLMSRGEIREVGIVGETPNLAARLQAAAQPGGIVVAEATQRITAGLFTYRALKPLALKGFDAPVQAFEALEATESGSRSRARAENTGTPIFGRDHELQILVDRWAEVRAGAGQVVLHSGRAGHRQVTPRRSPAPPCGGYAARAIDLELRTQQRGLHPLPDGRAACASGRFRARRIRRCAPPKLARLMARYGMTAPRGAAVIADLLGLPPSPSQPLEALTPDKLKAVTLDALLGILDAWASRKPALLAFEDLHWSDSTTLELLDRMVAKAKDRPWMIVATARPELANRWAGVGDLLHMELTRLDRGSAERICAHLDATAMLPPDALRQIVARCDGIPLFVEEMTKSVLEGFATAAARTGAPRVVIPATLHDSLVARLDRLGPARRIANVGATIGRRFGYDLLAEVASLPAAELNQRIARIDAFGPG